MTQNSTQHPNDDNNRMTIIGTPEQLATYAAELAVKMSTSGRKDDAEPQGRWLVGEGGSGNALTVLGMAGLLVRDLAGVVGLAIMVAVAVAVAAFNTVAKCRAGRPPRT
jgi:hypothetical protein